MLGQYLKNYRLKNNLNQTAMAKLLNTSQSYYSQIETGYRKPSYIMIERIAELLKQEASFIRSLL